MLPPGQAQQQVMKPSKGRSRTRLAMLVFAILLTTGSVVVGIRTQGLSADVSLLLSGFGVLLGLFQLLVPLPRSPSLVSRTRKPAPADFEREYEILHKQLEKDHKSNGLGALVIYTRKSLVGHKVSLYDSNAQSRTTFIAERTINRRTIYVAVVTNLQPDIYRVSLMFEEGSFMYKTVTTVQAGEVTELRLLGKLFNIIYRRW